MASGRHRRVRYLGALSLCILLVAPPLRAEEVVDDPPSALRHVSDPKPGKAPEAAPAPGFDLSPPVRPAILFHDNVHLPYILWPELRERWYFGPDDAHALDLRGSSMAYAGHRPWAEGLQASGGSLGVSYRYLGIFGGVLRPVVGFDAVISEDFRVPTASRGFRTQKNAALVPSAGLEVVVRGVGLGMRAAVPLWTYQSEGAFYHPQLQGKQGSFDWGRFFDHMIKNVYVIWEEKPVKKRD